MRKWTNKEIDWLVNNYPSIGLIDSALQLERTEGSIRQKASDLKLKSEYRFGLEANYKRGSAFRGKKRPEHSEWLKNNHPLKGKHRSQDTKDKISEKIKIAVKEGRVKTDNFKGHKHSESAREKMSIANMGRKVSQETIEKTLKTKFDRYGYYHKNTENAYSRCKRGWYDINGKRIYFRSLWEPNYALYLDFLIKQKEIVSWEYEKKTFWFEKIRRGVRSYTPDFEITNNDKSIHYEEVKGWMDSKSKTKIKRMAKYYPEVKLIVIDQKSYKDIKNKLGKLLKFY